MGSYQGKKTGQQARLFYGLMGLWLVMLVNSLLLYVLDFAVLSFAYRGSLVFHVMLGSLLVIPLVAFLVYHLGRMPHRDNRRSMWLGLLTAFGACVTLLSGLAMLAPSLNGFKSALLWMHLGSMCLSLLGIALHIKSRRKRSFHFFVPLNRKTWRISPLWRQTFSWSVSIGSFLMLLLIFSFRPQKSSAPTFTQDRMLPAAMVLPEKEWLDHQTLDGSSSCGDAGCHPDITGQWQESAHHFSSFNNPYYERSIEVLLEQGKPEKLRWCASCHDPLVLSSGGIEGDGFKVIKEHPARDKGITCLTCHSMQGAQDITGNGNYQLADPGYASMGQTMWGEWPEFRKQMIHSRPKPHGATLLSTYLKTEEYCTSCHKVSVPASVNDYRWKRGQNQYDAWHQSSFSNRHPRSFYTRDKQTCTTCHMPLVPSLDQGNDQGLVKSHRFAAANSALPSLNGHPDQLAAVKEFLQNDIAVVDIFRVSINGTSYGPEAKLPPFSPGDQVLVEVLVSNRNVGHHLPAGTNDSNEWWLEVALKNEAEQTLLISGGMRGAQVDSTAHFFRSVLIDEEGKLIDRRNVHQWRATVLSTAIPSGLTQLVRYGFEVPEGEIPSHLQVRLRQRKFNDFFHRFTFAKGANIPEIPIIDVALTQRKAGEVLPAKLAAWQRWNNYGIGLIGEENFAAALAAFKKVARMRPDLPDGRLNQGRVLLLEGDLLAAQKAFEAVLKDFPGHATASYFLGECLVGLGEHEAALAYWNELKSSYPRDPVLRSGLGELYYLLGYYTQAEEEYLAALEVDPENASALYRMMLLAGAQQKPEMAAQWQEKYVYHKNNEAEATLAGRYKQEHPQINYEAQPGHVHALSPPGLASKGDSL